MVGEVPLPVLGGRGRGGVWEGEEDEEADCGELLRERRGVRMKEGIGREWGLASSQYQEVDRNWRKPK